MSDWKNVQYKDGKFKTGTGGGGGASALSDLTDVDLTNLADGDTLVYDEQNQKWVNGAGGGGGGSSITALNTDQITSLNTPYNLSDAISNYDLILIQMYYTGGSGYPYCGTTIISPVLLSSHNNSTWIDGGNNDRALHVQFPTTTTIQIIQSNGGNGIHGVYGIKLVSSGGGGGSSTFAGLDDVSFNNIQNGQVPKYNSTTQKWENANESGGGGTVTDVEVDGVSVVNQQGVAEIETPNADGIEYDNQQSGLQATDVQSAIDELAQGGGGGHTYSTAEQVVGTWIDGKPIYEKVIQVTTTGGNYTLDVSSLHINEIIDFRIFVHNSTGGDYAFGSYWQDYNDRLGWYLQSNKNNLIIRSGNGYAYGIGWCVIQYTKTTD